MKSPYGGAITTPGEDLTIKNRHIRGHFATSRPTLETRIIESLHDPAKAMTVRYAPSAKVVT
jgi:hypothetical protein